MHPDHSLPKLVSASLDARLSPFAALRENSPQSPPRSVAGHSSGARHHQRASLGAIRRFKLLIAALGAGTRVVPLGDNHTAVSGLAAYVKMLNQC